MAQNQLIFSRPHVSRRMPVLFTAAACSAVLSRYMTGDIGVVTEGNSALLSAFLTWYDIPHASTLAHFDTQGETGTIEALSHLPVISFYFSYIFVISS